MRTNTVIKTKHSFHLGYRALAGALLLALPTTGYSVDLASPGANLSQRIKKELAQHLKQSGAGFENLLSNWERNYGTQAVSPLLSIARDKKNKDTYRYVAILGAARLGGAQAKKEITGFLSDRVWMIRMASLRGLTALYKAQRITEGEITTGISRLLTDPALVVRNEAVISMRKLQIQSLTPKLIRVLVDKKNYHHGKPLWVPEKALFALQELKAPGSLAKGLYPVLQTQKDPTFLNLVVNTLEKMTGKTLARGQPIRLRVQAWKKELKN